MIKSELKGGKCLDDLSLSLAMSFFNTHDINLYWNGIFIDLGMPEDMWHQTVNGYYNWIFF